MSARRERKRVIKKTLQEIIAGVELYLIDTRKDTKELGKTTALLYALNEAQKEANRW